VDENAAFSGFQSANDKWKQDNLTMTLFKWADLRDIAAGFHAMADAAAVSVGDAYTSGDGAYVVYRRGILRNFGAHIHKRPGSGGSSVSIAFTVYSLSGNAPSPIVANAQEWSGLAVTGSIIALGFAAGGDGASCTNIQDSLVIDATPAAPRLISCARNKTGGTWKDLTATAEFHYTS
jgi:hypothetical protein